MPNRTIVASAATILGALACASGATRATADTAKVADQPARPAPAPAAPSDAELAALTSDAVSPDRARADAAIAALRARGPSGLDALLRAHARDVATLRAGDARGRSDPGLLRLRRAVDEVAQQRDAHASGLYWYTDLETAKRRAKRLGRPILSLRLLGKLNEELSCANSRLFRTVLYADQKVAERLKRDFVLHWSSERPAPVITVDMRDGRKLRRTITGNSAHYVLSPDGTPVDVLPGLFSAPSFRRALKAARAIERRCTQESNLALCVRRAHEAALKDQERAWAELAKDSPMLADKNVDDVRLMDAPVVHLGAAPSAKEAMLAATSKAMIELPMLGLAGDSTVYAMGRQARTARDELAVWREAAEPVLAEFSPDQRTLGLMQLKLGEAPSRRMLELLRSSVAEDTVKNEHSLHRAIHRRFTSGNAESFAALNEWLYTNVFLTPKSDPWLGLKGRGVYDAVEVSLVESNPVDSEAIGDDRRFAHGSLGPVPQLAAGGRQDPRASSPPLPSGAANSPSASK